MTDSEDEEGYEWLEFITFIVVGGIIAVAGWVFLWDRGQTAAKDNWGPLVYNAIAFFIVFYLVCIAGVIFFNTLDNIHRVLARKKTVRKDQRRMKSLMREAIAVREDVLMLKVRLDRIEKGSRPRPMVKRRKKHRP